MHPGHDDRNGHNGMGAHSGHFRTLRYGRETDEHFTFCSPKSDSTKRKQFLTSVLPTAANNQTQPDVYQQIDSENVVPVESVCAHIHVCE